MARRRYSDDDRAAALAALDSNAGDLSKTARETGVPRQTIQRWVDGQVAATVPLLRQEKKAELSDVFETFARQAVAGITPEKIAAANAVQLLTAAGIAVDKMLLLRGEPTAIHRNESAVSDDQRRATILTILSGTGGAPIRDGTNDGPGTGTLAGPGPGDAARGDDPGPLASEVAPL